MNIKRTTYGSIREVVGVENTLKQQIVAAIEAPYIEALRDIVKG